MSFSSSPRNSNATRSSPPPSSNSVTPTDHRQRFPAAGSAASSQSQQSSSSPPLLLKYRRLLVTITLILVNLCLIRNLRSVHRTISTVSEGNALETNLMLQHLLTNVRVAVNEQLSEVQGSVRKQVRDVLLSAAEAIGDGTSSSEQGNTNNQNATGNAATTGGSASPSKRLNILILYPDDMRHDSLGVAGTQAVQTPFLDSLARKGMRFTHNCVTTSICWISRANLFTGQYVSRHGATKLRTPIDPTKWNDTWPAILKEHGYHTGHIGKWQYWDSGLTSKRYSWAKIYEGSHYYGDMHVTDLNHQDALFFLREHRPKDKPFALQIAFYAPKAVGTGDMQWTPKNESAHLYSNLTFEYPSNMNESFARLPAFHWRGEARNRWNQRFGTPAKYDASMKNYYRMITEVDECSRKVVAEIERQGLLNETMIIFTTDNGFYHAEHGLSGKWFPYQESIRVPLIIWDPRMPASVQGTTNDDFTLNIDLAETILGAAGLSPHPSMQGRDISDLYLPQHNETPWRKEFYYEFPGLGANFIPTSNAVVRKDFKLFHYPEHNVWQLFNLEDDPLEEIDLINEPKYADLIVELKQRYEEMKASVV
ncbi:hypothetical protein MPSEU_000688000 [Mayamaea pseudoterrestris]|nr:hypothetical protein MPSEU_000688000 [Mayamaea pseudoterrestris]